MSQDSPNLPQEILDEIVDHLPHRSVDALKAIALTSRRFLERARRHLFSNVYLTDPLWLPVGTWKIFRFNPSLFKFARRIIVKRAGLCVQVSDSTLQEVLGCMKDVRALDIADSCILREWIKVGLFDVFLALVKLSIDLDHDMPIDFLYSLPLLQHLRIRYSSSLWESRTSKESNVLIPPWKLKSLHYSHAHDGPMDPWVPHLMSRELGAQAVYGGLVHLCLDIRRASDHRLAMSRILPACQNSPLETLRLSYFNDFYGSRGLSRHGGLPSLPYLRLISIGLPSFWKEDRPAMPRPQAEFLSTLIGQSGQPALEAMDILFSWDMGRLTSSELISENLIIPELGWDEMGAIFASRTLHPRLRAVRITTQMEGRRGGAREKYRSTDESVLGRVLRDQTIAALSSASDRRGLLVDARSGDTQYRFDQIVRPIANGVWESSLEAV